jgi:hypothetical protein
LKLEKVTLLSGWKSQTDSFQLQISSAKSDISDDFQMSRGSCESVAATWPTTIYTQIRVLAARNFREARGRYVMHACILCFDYAVKNQFFYKCFCHCVVQNAVQTQLVANTCSCYYGWFGLAQGNFSKLYVLLLFWMMMVIVNIRGLVN